MRSQYTVLYLLALTFLLAGCCDDGDDVNPEMPDPWVEVREVPGHQPLPGIKVVVMDPATNLPAMNPVVTDSSGLAVFPGLPPGDYRLLAYGGATHQIVSLPARWEQTLSKGAFPGAGLTGPVAKTPPLAPAPQILLGPYDIPGGLGRIAGRVFDAVTGDPISGAFISVSPFLTGYTGKIGTKDDVTLDDGSFMVHDIIFALVPGTDNMEQVELLLVTRQGYRPRSWRYNVPNGDNNQDIKNVRIELEPQSAADNGILFGRMLLDGQPAADVVVGLGRWGDYPFGKSGPGLTGQVAVADDAGEYRFEGLAAGRYYVQGGFLPLDGFFQAGANAHEVIPGQETDAGDQVLHHEIQLQSPPNGGEYASSAQTPDLQWSAVDGASYYKLTLGALISGPITETTLPVPPELASGRYEWGVTAYDSGDVALGGSEVAGLFYIIGPELP